MREILRSAVDEMAVPSQQARTEATQNWGSSAAHSKYMADWSCMREIELRQPEITAPTPETLTIAAWNIERCKHVEGAAALIRKTGADIVLATEVDHGMARSSQRHTTADLARELGFGYAFGVEFVELGIGDPFEVKAHTGEENLHGLHGNAIVSRFPLHDVAVIPLDDGGDWYVRAPKNDGQYRVGGRMAIAAKVQTTQGPLALAAVHFESESDAGGRELQTERMLTGLNALYGEIPCLIGGDLNTAGFAAKAMTGQETLAAPQAVEPAFNRFAKAGFDWRDANTPAITTRHAPGRVVQYPLRKIDWLFSRSVQAQESFVQAALSERGEYLSDHELIATRVSLL